MERDPNPWNAIGRLVLFLASIAAIYLFFRFAIFLPDVPNGWALVVNLAALAGVGALAWRAQRNRRVRREPSVGTQIRAAPLKAVLAAALVIGLTFPIWVTLYFVWLGGQLWR